MFLTKNRRKFLIFLNGKTSQKQNQKILVLVVCSMLITFLQEVRHQTVAMFLVTSPIVINVPTRGLLAVETMHAIVQWLAKKYDVNVCKQETSLLLVYCIYYLVIPSFILES